MSIKVMNLIGLRTSPWATPHCSVHFEVAPSFVMMLLCESILTRPASPSAAILSPFSNGNKLRWVRFSTKSCPYGTKRTRTAQWKTLVHLLLILSTICGHLTGIFEHVTREHETLSERTKGIQPYPPHRTQPHTNKKHPILTPLPRATTEPPHNTYTDFPEPENNHETHTTEPRVDPHTRPTTHDPHDPRPTQSRDPHVRPSRPSRA